MADPRRQEREESELQRRERLTVFRPESAPTVLAPGVAIGVGSSVSGPLDMSPEASLSGPPSAHDISADGMGKILVGNDIYVVLTETLKQ